MTTLKLTNIGNSKGIRLPKKIISKYHFDSTLVMEELEDGILIKSNQENKSSWEDTYKQKAAEKEDFSGMENANLDGLENEDFQEWK